MLADAPLSPSIATTDLQKAKEFYGQKLGLKLAEDWGQAASFKTPNGDIFVYQREKPVAPDATVIHWWVADIRATVRGLKARGITFEIYEGYGQDADGISAASENGPWAAWFKDPDGNVLGVTQMPKE